MPTSSVPKKVYCKIGEIVATWSLIESTIDGIILDALVIHPEQGLLLTAALATPAKLDILQIVMRHAGSKAGKSSDVSNLMGRIKVSYTKRNEAAHHAWFPSDGAGDAKRMAIKVRGGKIREVEEITTISDLSKISEELDDILVRLNKLYDDGVVVAKYSA